MPSSADEQDRQPEPAKVECLAPDDDANESPSGPQLNLSYAEIGINFYDGFGYLPPQVLEQYKKIDSKRLYPELLDKINRQFDHRLEIEKDATTKHQIRQDRGQLIGAIGAVGALIVAAICAASGAAWASVLLTALAIGGPVASRLFVESVRRRPALPTKRENNT